MSDTLTVALVFMAVVSSYWMLLIAVYVARIYTLLKTYLED